jgi:hypothetical protein
MTPALKVEAPMPLFVVETVAVGHVVCVLAEIETEAERALGCFGPREYDAFKVVNIPNRGRFNRILEQMGVSYAPCPVLALKPHKQLVRNGRSRCPRKQLLKEQKLVQAKHCRLRQRRLRLKWGQLKKLAY